MDSIYINLYENFNAFLKSLDNSKLEKLKANKLELKLSLIPAKTMEKKITKPIDKVEIPSLVSTLSTLGSRSEGVDFLGKYNKQSLQFIAKELDIPVSKKDSKERLTKKLVENTIGFRLNSKAIRNNPSA